MAQTTNLARAPEWRTDIEGMTREFMRSLPKQVPTDRFVRVIITAMQQNPDLALADRHSLKLACMKAAEDGLLPDGREGFLNIYNTEMKDKKTGKSVWVNIVQWQPMVWGLVKKARNSGEIAGITAHVVYYHDHFRRILGDDERFEHEQPDDIDDSELIEANARGAYAIATLKDGTKIRAWRARRHVMLAKSKSKAQRGMLWGAFWEEAWLKTAIRYLNKYLPKDQSSGFSQAAERTDEEYDFDRAKDVTPPRSRLERFVQNQQVAAQANGDTDGDYAPIPEEPPSPVQTDLHQAADPLFDVDPTIAREPNEEGRVPVTWAVTGHQVLLRPEKALSLWAEKSAGKTDVWKRAVLNRNPALEQLLKEQAEG